MLNLGDTKDRLAIRSIGEPTRLGEQFAKQLVVCMMAPHLLSAFFVVVVVVGGQMSWNGYECWGQQQHYYYFDLATTRWRQKGRPSLAISNTCACCT